MLKCYSGISRDYDLNFQEPGEDLEAMKLWAFDEDSEHFYLLLNPLDLNTLSNETGTVLNAGGDLYFVLRIKRKWQFKQLIKSVFDNKDNDNIYNLYKDYIRIEGVIRETSLDDDEVKSSLSLFLSKIEETSRGTYLNLVSSQSRGDIDYPELLAGSFKTKAQDYLNDGNYEAFLTGFHNVSGISAGIKKVLESILDGMGGDINAPWIFKELTFKPFIEENKKGTEENKIGLYANFNLLNYSSKGDTSKAKTLVDDGFSGLGLNLTEGLIQNFALSYVHYEMKKKLDAEEITAEYFDSIDYSFPFDVPPEFIQDLFDLKKSVPLSSEPYLRIKSISFEKDEHKFEGYDEKKDAVKITVKVKVKDKDLFSEVFDWVAPTTFKIKIFIGFDNSGDKPELLINIKEKASIKFITLLVSMLLGLAIERSYYGAAAGLLAGIGLTLLTEYVVQLKIEGATDDKIEEFKNNFKSNNYGFAVVKNKRWDPLYYTNHKIGNKLIKGHVNEKGQIKLTAQTYLFKDYEPYTNMYISKVHFSNNFEPDLLSLVGPKGIYIDTMSKAANLDMTNNLKSKGEVKVKMMSNPNADEMGDTSPRPGVSIGKANSGGEDDGKIEMTLDTLEYTLNEIDSVVKDELPASDREPDMFYSHLLKERKIKFKATDFTLNELKKRAAVGKLYISIPHTPLFVCESRAELQHIWLLSDVRLNEIKYELLDEYVNTKVQEIINLVLALIQSLNPDYDIDSISDSDLSDLKKKLKSIIKDTESYKEYKKSGYLEDVYNEYKTELLSLTPKQMIKLGVINHKTFDSSFEDFIGGALFPFMSLSSGYSLQERAPEFFILSNSSNREAPINVCEPEE